MITLKLRSCLATYCGSKCVYSLRPVVDIVGCNQLKYNYDLYMLLYSAFICYKYCVLIKFKRELFEFLYFRVSVIVLKYLLNVYTYVCSCHGIMVCTTLHLCQPNFDDQDQRAQLCGQHQSELLQWFIKIVKKSNYLVELCTYLFYKFTWLKILRRYHYPDHYMS